MSEPMGISPKTEGKTVKWYEPPHVRCKQGHEVEYDDAMHATITGVTRIVVSPLCPMCIASFLRERFGMDAVMAENGVSDGD